MLSFIFHILARKFVNYLVTLACKEHYLFHINDPIKCVTRIPHESVPFELFSFTSTLAFYSTSCDIFHHGCCKNGRRRKLRRYSGDIWLLRLYLFRLYVNGIKLGNGRARPKFENEFRV